MTPAPDLHAPAAIDRLVAITAYEDGGAQLVRALKYGNQRSALTWAAVELAMLVGVRTYDQITWMPSSPNGKRQRGYEPSKLLAQRLAKALRVPAVKLLTRRSTDAGQTERNRNERLRGPALAASSGVIAPRILIVDDVCTTGASLSAAARILRRGGAEGTDAAVIARTP